MGYELPYDKTHGPYEAVLQQARNSYVQSLFNFQLVRADCYVPFSNMDPVPCPSSEYDY